MNAKLLASLVLLAATSVQAQNTAQANLFRRDMCELVATRAGYSYKFKEKGMPPIQMNTVPESPIKLLMIWGINYGRFQATSVDDAYRVSQAKCMDNIDRVYRDDRAGKLTAESELQ